MDLNQHHGVSAGVGSSGWINPTAERTGKTWTIFFRAVVPSRSVYSKVSSTLIARGGPVVELPSSEACVPSHSLV